MKLKIAHYTLLARARDYPVKNMKVNETGNKHKNPKKLIIVADDFGISKSITNGIAYCLENGLVTDVSIMPNGEYFEEAADILLELGRGCMGIHLTAVDEEFPLSDRLHVSHLIRPSGKFFANKNGLLFNCSISSRTRKQLYKEFSLQMNAVIKKGLSIAHISTHQHLHLFPALISIVLGLSYEFKVPFIRLPKTNRFSFSMIAVRSFGYIMKNKLRHSPIMAIESYGIDFSGRTNEAYLKSLLTRLNQPITELTVHPGFNDEHSFTKYQHWKYDWQQEIAALESVGWRDAIRNSGVCPVSFKDLIWEHK